MKVFVAHSVKDSELVEGIASQLGDAGHDVLVPSRIQAGANLLSIISAGILSADAFVAVVSAENPNIFYELGLAAGAGVPILIAARSSELIPWNLASTPYVQLTGDVSRDVQAIVRRAATFEGLAKRRTTIFKSAESELKAASRDPAYLESLDPGDFERLLADLFKKRGDKVATAGPRDAGADLVVTSPSGDSVVVVQVKKLSRHNRISVETVRQLANAVSSTGASTGLLVATSGFTSAALELAAGTPVVLRTLDEVLAANSMQELLQPRKSD